MPDTHRPRPARVAVPVLVAAALMGAACGAPPVHRPVAAPHATVLTVAVELPLSGPDAAEGADVLRGAQVAAALVDAAGGVLGRQLRVVARDDGGRSSLVHRTMGALLRLRPAAVMGQPDPSRSALEAAMVRRAGVPFVSLAAGGPATAGAVTVTWTDDQLARVEAQEVTGVLRARTVAVVEDPASAAAGVMTAMSPLLAQAGVAVAPPVPLASSAVAGAAIGQALSSHPDALLLAGAPGDAAALATAAGAAGMSGRCVVVESAPGPPPRGGPPTGCVTGGVPPVASLPGGASLAAAVHARFHTTAGIWAAFGADALRVVVAALRDAGATGPARVGAALLRVAGVAGVTGDITVDPATGTRRLAPLAVLDLGTEGAGAVDPTWFAFAAWPPLPAK